MIGRLSTFKLDQVATIAHFEVRGSPAQTCVIAFVCASIDVLKMCKTLFNTAYTAYCSILHTCSPKSPTQIQIDILLRQDHEDEGRAGQGLCSQAGLMEEGQRGK